TIQMTASPMSAAQAGFQMSYAAMAGIAFIYPVFRKIWDKDTAESNRAIACIGKLPRIIWNSAAISISCQLTTGPVAYLYFGTFPLNFILTNLIAVPLTGAVMPAALAALFLSYAGICPDFLLYVLEAAVRTLHTSLEIIAGM
ncbi:MAG: ComEC/Rec2 family competence protein, partial [Bacteroidales bacterium]|nr:ComEC/Rec2 family competence protein [Bacteroidales bacterium]